jgi:hypothetical protein
MKYFLLIVLTFFTASLVAQENKITIKAQSKTVTVSIDDDNSDKTLLLNSNLKILKTDKLVAHNSNTKELKDWQRSFMIFDEAGVEILKLQRGPTHRYNQVVLKDIFSKLQKDKVYELYTVALPKDPKKAALVRVRRVLICKIRVK